MYIMKRYKISVLILAALCTGCSGNSKKQTLAPATESDTTKLTVNLKYETEIVMDTVIPRPGVRYTEVRKINPSAPPVRLNMAQDAEKKELKLTDYYSKVKYVKLKHPFAGQNRHFLDNTQCEILFEDGGGSLITGAYSSVYLTADNIVAGDYIFGYHCYDREGNFIYTIAVMDDPPEYSRKISVQITPGKKFLRNISLLDDNCMIFTAQGRYKIRMDLHNITARKTYLSRPWPGNRTMFITPDSYLTYRYNVLAREPEPFMYTFDIKGDTLCRFMNHNPLAAPARSAYTNPDDGSLYHYNNVPTVRQPYNDTVYRMTSPGELTAAYVFDFGERRLDMNTALFGDKSDRLIPNEWIETDRFVFIIHTENYDCPNNRNNNSVKFFYSYYDKNDGKLYRIPFNGLPNGFILSNEIDGGMPVLFGNMQVYGGIIYTRYTKSLLDAILKHKNFSSLPVAQQEKTRAMYDDLQEDEMLVMILE
jgi:hypothetical protein